MRMSKQKQVSEAKPKVVSNPQIQAKPRQKKSVPSTVTMVSMPVVNAKAAGIDVGSRFHMVAVGQDKAKDVVSFGVTTPDLHDLCQFLTKSGIQKVAMESTGYYWIPLYWMLQSYGFETIVVNPSDIKKFKKTDVDDALWIQQLHTLGLLNASFQVDNFGETLRSFVRRRRTLIQDRNRYMNRMHKVLILMNVQIGTQLTDLGGASGMDIIRAIVAGERDPNKLISFIRKGVKTTKHEILKALQGTWQPHFLFQLDQLLQSYDIASKQIAACDQQVEELLTAWHEDNTLNPPDPKEPPKPSEKKALDGKNLPPFQVTRLLNSMVGVDLLEVGGLNSRSMLEIIAETGTDLHQFPSAQHFASWLGLAPNTKKSGGKELSSRTPKRTNRAANAFRQVANAIGRSNEHPLKPFFHTIQKSKGWKAAVTATARKTALIYFCMVVNNQPFNYQKSEQQIQKQRQATLRKIQKSIKELNFSMDELNALAA